MIVVSNAGPLIALSKLGLLSVLQDLFGEIIVPEEVWNEVVERGKGKPGSDLIKKAKWIHIKKQHSYEFLNSFCFFAFTHNFRSLAHFIIPNNSQH